MLPFRDRPENPDSPIAPPFPDVVISSGRRTLPYLKAVKKASGNKTITVCLKDPKTGTSAADVIWVPVHDRLRGDNVIATLTSPHPLSLELLAEARTEAETRFADFPKKRVGLILGGNTRGVTWKPETCADFDRKLSQIPQNGHSILAVASRRTPPQLEETVKQALKNHTHFYSTGIDENDNPYRQVLSIADILIVTGDSHNMVSEALATGTPVYVYRPQGLKQKLHQFLADLEDLKLVRNFEGSIETFPTKRVNSTDQIVEAVREMLGK
jgi:mitochondrial fission protein ELM1